MVEIYTDGSCLRNPNGPSGSGVVMIYKNHVKTISVGLGGSTNNIAELNAILEALKAVKPNKRHFEMVIHTDSKYAIGVLTGKMKAKKNLQLIENIRRQLTEFDNLTFKWVKGHNGNRWNEIADKLALIGSKSPKDKRDINLFQGLEHKFFNDLLRQ